MKVNTAIFTSSKISTSVFSFYFWTAFLDFCVFVFVSPGCPLLYYFAREHLSYCVTVFLRFDWLNVSLLLFQIWYLANWIFRSLFPTTQGAVTRFNPYEFLIVVTLMSSDVATTFWYQPYFCGRLSVRFLPISTMWALALLMKFGPHRDRENSDQGENWAHDLRDWSPLLHRLPTRSFMWRRLPSNRRYYVIGFIGSPSVLAE